MPMFDHKNECESHPTIFSGTAGIAALTGTAVDLAKAVGAMVLFTFGSAIGTAAVAPYIHESSDNVAGTADFQGGGLVGTTTFTGSGGSRSSGTPAASATSVATSPPAGRCRRDSCRGDNGHEGGRHRHHVPGRAPARHGDVAP